MTRSGRQAAAPSATAVSGHLRRTSQAWNGYPSFRRHPVSPSATMRLGAVVGSGRDRPEIDAWLMSGGTGASQTRTGNAGPLGAALTLIGEVVVSSTRSGQRLSA